MDKVQFYYPFYRIVAESACFLVVPKKPHGSSLFCPTDIGEKI